MFPKYTGTVIIYLILRGRRVIAVGRVRGVCISAQSALVDIWAWVKSAIPVPVHEPAKHLWHIPAGFYYISRQMYRSRDSVEERPPGMRKVLGSIPDHAIPKVKHCAFSLSAKHYDRTGRLSGDLHRAR